MDEDECLVKFCNGGECINKIGSYECYCCNGILGKNCELLIGIKCIDIMCSSYGRCIIVNGKFVCNCN